jgi:16S rRNA (uracil1498-N3)-methyltransferase
VADRFYCPEPPTDGHITLRGEEAHHLSRVRRLERGDRAEVFNGLGASFLSQVVSVARDHVDLEVLEGPTEERSSRLSLTLATAVPKGERFDWLVEKATELGVVRLVPVITARSVVEPRAAKVERLRRLVVEACKQSGRNRLMELAAPEPWEALARSISTGTRWLAHPGGAAPHGWNRPETTGWCTLAVGPEGGFTPAEVDDAKAQGWQPIHLGATRLRIETAAIAGCAAVLALCEGWDE